MGPSATAGRPQWSILDMTIVPSHPDATSHYDLLVVGATPGGVSCAIRAAREGLRVLLTEVSLHVGGTWACGVQVFDTRYAGHRCPVLSEFTARLGDYYRRLSGDGSPDHALSRFGDATRHGERPRFEPHVAERVLREMLADQKNVSLILGIRLDSVVKVGNTLRGATFRVVASTSNESVEVSADVFVDATYEADLADRAGATFRIGREGRDAFGEPHAGVHFTTIEPIGEIGQTIARRLNLHYFNRTSRKKFAASTGHSDRAIQSYSARLVLTNWPDNRVEIRRPDGYKREHFLGILDRSPEAHTRPYPLSSHYLHGDIEDYRFVPNLPRGKMDWLGANLVGGNHDYPGADWSRRHELYRLHVAHSVGLIHFLQHDSAVPAALRDHVRQWGLARDEYPDSGNVPHAIYVREARRLAGQYVFSEHDATQHPNHERSPIHADSIAFAEWPMDSHDCNPIRQPGSFNDGEMILAEETLPSQIPFRCLLTDAAENLIVPVAMSATHIGWGTLRLEPVFIHTGEVAGLAAAMCHRQGRSAAELDVTLLQNELLRRGMAISYFSDLELCAGDPMTNAFQLLSTKGFFGTYDATPWQMMSEAMIVAWRETLENCRRECTDLNVNARLNVEARLKPHARNLASLNRLASDWNPRDPLSVGDAARQLWERMVEGNRLHKDNHLR